jgi:hypothetical protein
MKFKIVNLDRNTDGDIVTAVHYPATNSSMSSNPITINSSVVVTIPSGSRWVVL